MILDTKTAKKAKFKMFIWPLFYTVAPVFIQTDEFELQYLSFCFLWAHFSLLHSPNLNQIKKAFHLLDTNYSNQAPVQHNPVPPHLTTDVHTAMTKLDVLLKGKINVYITDGS